jgi:hypothetical protein
MSQINVNTVNEYASANGVTVDGVLIKDGAIASSFISGLSGGLDCVQQFRVLTANVTSNGYITSNWEVPDSGNQTNLGSLVSESSGEFSFSETGFYQVSFTAGYEAFGSGNAYGTFRIYSTTDNSTYVEVARAYFGGTGSTDWGQGTIDVILDITNTTNDKVKMYFAEASGDTRLNGDSTINSTYVTFKKLGDT